MAWLRRLFGWTPQRDRALREELEAHRALVEDELRRAGYSGPDARTETRRRLGSVTLATEDAREVWTLRWLDAVKQHVRFGARGLRREPLFALTAIAMLALGIAATTTVFSVIDAEMWRPLPYPDPYRLVQVYSRGSGARTNIDGISLDELADWRTVPGLSSLAATGHWRRRTLQLAQAESIVTSEVTANYFTTLGLTALRGRVFSEADARGSNAALLTDRGWTRLFDRDPNVLGRVVTIDESPHAIVGLVADDEALGSNPELFLPIDERPSSAAGSDRTVVFGAMGRLAEGASANGIRNEVQSRIARRALADVDQRGHTAFVEDLSSFYTPLDEGKLYFFFGASLLVLLLTVVNTAGLLLSRILRRAPEFALRGALGGGAGALATQLVVEAALIVVPGALLGLWTAMQAIGLVGQVLPPDYLLRGTHITLDLRVFVWCGGIALVTLTGLAVVPLRLARRAGISAMSSGARTIGLPSAGRTRTMLLTFQLALTVILLAGAGMFLRSFVALLQVPLGFEPTAAWSARVDLSGPRYADDGRRRAYAEALIERARTIPGVGSVAVATSSPLMSGWLVHSFDARRPVGPGDAGLHTIYRAVGGDYFRTIGTPIVRGRPLDGSDTAAAPAVAVVNEQFVRNLFPQEDPIGRTIDLAPGHGSPIARGLVTIVGVASDIIEVGPNEVAFADIYVPFAQRPATALELLVRGPAGNASMATALRASAAAVDPTMPVTSTTSLVDRVAASTNGARFNLVLVSGFAAAALLIAAIGIYGAMAYAATARWREYGVRLALGATPRDLVGRSLWHAARLGLVGGAIGVVGAVLFALWLGDSLYLVAGQHSGILYDVTTTDPPSLAAALAGVVVLALLAGAIPACRVARVDPVKALRAE